MDLNGVESLNFQGYLISRLFRDFVLNMKNKQMFSYHFFLFLSNVCCLSPAHTTLENRRVAQRPTCSQFRAKLNNQGNSGRASPLEENNSLEILQRPVT